MALNLQTEPVLYVITQTFLGLFIQTYHGKYLRMTSECFLFQGRGPFGESREDAHNENSKERVRLKYSFLVIIISCLQQLHMSTIILNYTKYVSLILTNVWATTNQ